MKNPTTLQTQARVDKETSIAMILNIKMKCTHFNVIISIPIQMIIIITIETNNDYNRNNNKNNNNKNKNKNKNSNRNNIKTIKQRKSIITDYHGVYTNNST